MGEASRAGSDSNPYTVGVTHGGELIIAVSAMASRRGWELLHSLAFSGSIMRGGLLTHDAHSAAAEFSASLRTVYTRLDSLPV